MHEFNFILDCSKEAAALLWEIIENHCDFHELEPYGGWFEQKHEEDSEDVQEKS